MDKVHDIVNYVQQFTIYSDTMTTPECSGIINSDPLSPDIGEIAGNEEQNVKNLADAYLTLPEEILSMTSTSDLEEAVDQCKSMVLELPDESEEKKYLVRRLIELRLRLHVVKEALQDENAAKETLKENTVVLGHHFQRQSHPKSLDVYYCDRCSRVIWNAIHVWHLCLDCDYKCHIWCLNQVGRICAHVVVCEEPSFIAEICPEASNGLASQNYRCIECLTHTSFSDSILKPRLCDYNGKYYCPTCHWNSTAIIPARVIMNWDFTEHRVCRASKQILRLLFTLPIIQLEKLNPALFNSTNELQTTKALRLRLLHMKKYLTSCKRAVEENITWQLKERLHFLENSDRYSMQDLIDLKAGTLVPQINRLMETFTNHITQECKICSAQGYLCEYCGSKSVIYPFQLDIECCPVCGTAYHLNCWLSNQKNCRKCNRRQRRLTESAHDS